MIMETNLNTTSKGGSLPVSVVALPPAAETVLR